MEVLGRSSMYDQVRILFKILQEIIHGFILKTKRLEKANRNSKNCIKDYVVFLYNCGLNDLERVL